MKKPETAPEPERQDTDESLRRERENTDEALAEARKLTQVTADALVDRARLDADQVLVTARDKADAKLDEPTVPALQTVATERRIEDATLATERASADEVLRQEREAQAQALAALLPAERQKTDRFLLSERALSDDKLAHRDDFLGIVSHDLRSLLSGILLTAASVSERAGSSPEGERTVAGMARIERYVTRMNRLIEDLVDVVSIDAGKLTVKVASHSATSLIAEAVDAFSVVAAQKGVGMKSECAEGLVAEFDHDRVFQVLANLVTNAVKFTPTGGEIFIRAERTETDLQVTVADTGIGIAEPMLEVIFDRFAQVDKSDQRGLGLGLYISRCIIAAHGGRIWAESHAGQGSSFKFTIPPAGATSIPLATPQTPAP